MATILVTGGCGLLGDHICSGLLKKGNTVIAADTKQSEYNTGKDHFIYREAGARDQNAFGDIFDEFQIDFVVHLACTVDNDLGPIIEKPQVEETRIKAIAADVYLCSSNAITEDGRLVNIDGTGNRLAGMIYGPKTVILAVGKNKLVKDYDEAIARIKRDACGPNARRQGFQTPCSIDNVCRD